MPETRTDLSSLLALLDQASRQAAELGPEGRSVVTAIDQAVSACRAVADAAGPATEGIRVDDLTTGNDK